MAGLPWARPVRRPIENDRALIEAFARSQRFLTSEPGRSRREVDDDDEDTIAADRPLDVRLELASSSLPSCSWRGTRRLTISARSSRAGSTVRARCRLRPWLERLREHRIKTVLNLRGSNLGDAWYRDEVAATNHAGATQVDVAMSSCVWMSRAQLRALIGRLMTAEYPMLIHCAWGSERTGLVSAFAELLRPGGTLARRPRPVFASAPVRAGQ